MDKENIKKKLAFLFASNIFFAAAISAIVCFIIALMRGSDIMYWISLTFVGIGAGLGIFFYKKESGQLKSVRFEIGEENQNQVMITPAKNTSPLTIQTPTPSKEPEKEEPLKDPLETEEIEIPNEN